MLRRGLVVAYALGLACAWPSVAWAQPEDPAADPAEPPAVAPDEGEGADEDGEDAGADKPEAPPAAPVPSDTGAAADTPATPGAESEAAGATDDTDTDAGSWLDWVRVGGYLQPGFQFTYRPQGRPLDEINYNFFGRAGLIVEAAPFEWWRGRLELVFSDRVLDVLVDVDLVDSDGDGSTDTTFLTRTQVPGSILQELSVTFQPSEYFSARAGAMFIPFTLQQQSANTALLFNTRSRANDVFLAGADFGLQLNSNIKDIAIISAGVFNGSSLGLTTPFASARGPLIAARLDVNPMGQFTFGEGDIRRGPFRLGIGFGTLVRPATVFDVRTGTEPRSVTDFRLAASLRMAVKGLYTAFEYFRRQQTDDFSFRPEVADGAYGQVAFFFPVHENVGLEPLARIGFVANDQTFDPRLTGYLNAGVGLYPVLASRDPDGVRLILSYAGERRFTEQEEAHGATASLQLKF